MRPLCIIPNAAKRREESILPGAYWSRGLVARVPVAGHLDSSSTRNDIEGLGIGMALRRLRMGMKMAVPSPPSFRPPSRRPGVGSLLRMRKKRGHRRSTDGYTPPIPWIPACAGMMGGRFVNHPHRHSGPRAGIQGVGGPFGRAERGRIRRRRGQRRSADGYAPTLPWDSRVRGNDGLGDSPTIPTVIPAPEPESRGGGPFGRAERGRIRRRRGQRRSADGYAAPLPWIPACAGMTGWAIRQPYPPSFRPPSRRPGVRSLLRMRKKQGHRRSTDGYTPPIPWIPACAGMTGGRFVNHTHRHSGPRAGIQGVGGPFGRAERGRIRRRRGQRRSADGYAPTLPWIPACAGMTGWAIRQPSPPSFRPSSRNPGVGASLGRADAGGRAERRNLRRSADGYAAPLPWIPACAGMTGWAIRQPYPPSFRPPSRRPGVRSLLRMRKKQGHRRSADGYAPPIPWIPACAGMMGGRFAKYPHRHSGPRAGIQGVGGPFGRAERGRIRRRRGQRRSADGYAPTLPWIPACAGMTGWAIRQPSPPSFRPSSRNPGVGASLGRADAGGRAERRNLRRSADGYAAPLPWIPACAGMTGWAIRQPYPPSFRPPSRRPGVGSLLRMRKKQGHRRSADGYAPPIPWIPACAGMMGGRFAKYPHRHSGPRAGIQGVGGPFGRAERGQIRRRRGQRRSADGYAPTLPWIPACAGMTGWAIRQEGEAGYGNEPGRGAVVPGGLRAPAGRAA